MTPLAGCLIAILLALLAYSWASSLKPVRSGRTLGGHVHETFTTSETQTQAQAGTTAAPPPGGAAAGQQQAQPAQATTTHTTVVRTPSSSSSGGFLPLWVGKLVLAAALILLLNAFVPLKPLFGALREQWKGVNLRGEPALPYHYTGPGTEGELTPYTTDRQMAGQGFYNGFLTEPPNGASLFDVNMREICSVWKPNDRIGDTLFFQCWGRRHECLGPNSDHHKDPVFPLKNGRGYWVIGSPWDCDYVVEGTEVLHAWTNSPRGPVTIKFRTRKRTSRSF